jgi:hypothetical protein
VNADRCLQYGDGSLIPREYLDSAVDFITQTRAMVTWKKGDVILIDVSGGTHRGGSVSGDADK